MMSDAFFAVTRQFFESRFLACVPVHCEGSLLAEAILYMCKQPGKRLRPALVFATGHSFGIPFEDLFPAAAAVEFIHTYSLVHDDLPAMDNDDLRRGQPTCHKAYDEALAILVGDALQALAFEQLGHPAIDPKLSQASIFLLCQAIGARGLVGGQAHDMQNSVTNLHALASIHARKTGSLIKACLQLGAIFSKQPPYVIDAMGSFGEHLGLAFQIKDDILDCSAETKILGKPSGSDRRNKKVTYPTLLGLKASEELLKSSINDAKSVLKTLNLLGSPLEELSDFVANRVY